MNSTVKRNDILRSDHLKYCAGKISACKHGSVGGRIYCHLAVFIRVSGGRHSNGFKNITCFLNRNSAFLSGVFFVNFNDCQSIFFLCVISRNCEGHGCAVQNITHRSLNLNKRIFAVEKNLGSDEVSLVVCVKYIDSCGSRIAESHRNLLTV